MAVKKTVPTRAIKKAVKSGKISKTVAKHAVKKVMNSKKNTA